MLLMLLVMYARFTVVVIRRADCGIVEVALFRVRERFLRRVGESELPFAALLFVSVELGRPSETPTAVFTFVPRWKVEMFVLIEEAFRFEVLFAMFTLVDFPGALVHRGILTVGRRRVDGVWKTWFVRMGRIVDIDCTSEGIVGAD